MISPLLVAAVVAAITLTLARLRVLPRDIAWLAGSPSVPPAEAAVYTRYLRRHRVHRLVGGLFGVVLAVVIGLRWFGTVTIGIGMGNPLGDVLFCGLAGVLVGALSAESFRLSQPRATQVAASLEVRGVQEQVPLVRTVWLAILAALILGVLVLVVGRAPGPLAAAVVGLAVALVGEVTRTAITARRRPLLSERARDVDARMRGFATGAVTRLQLAAAILTAGWTLALVPWGRSGLLPVVDGLLSAVRLLAILSALAAAVTLLHRAAPRAPRGWMPA